jgi:hypothetical protein
LPMAHGQEVVLGLDGLGERQYIHIHPSLNLDARMAAAHPASCS